MKVASTAFRCQPDAARCNLMQWRLVALAMGNQDPRRHGRLWFFLGTARQCGVFLVRRRLLRGACEMRADRHWKRLIGAPFRNTNTDSLRRDPCFHACFTQSDVSITTCLLLAQTRSCSRGMWLDKCFGASRPSIVCRSIIMQKRSVVYLRGQCVLTATGACDVFNIPNRWK